MIRRVLVSITLLLVAGLAVGAFLLSRPPAVRPAGDRVVERTPERLARGTHLAENVLGCTLCHSEIDPERFGGVVVPGTMGAGGHCLDREGGFPGVICAPNITPDVETGTGAWSDDELLRALREGVSRDGHALFPMMPWSSFRQLPEEDALALVVWMRSLEPRHSDLPATELDLPLRWIVRRMPEPLEGPVPAVDRSDEVAWGRHLATVAHCGFCHTPTDGREQPLEGMAFAGGKEVGLPGSEVVRVSPNITPDPTGLGGWDRATFLERFRTLGGGAEIDPSRNSPMPWSAFARMSDEELGAIWAFLRTVAPVENRVSTLPASSPHRLVAER